MTQKEIERKISREFETCASDLAQCCIDSGEKPEIHELDFLDMLYSHSVFGNYEETTEIDDQIIAAIKRLYRPNKKGMIRL